MRWGDDRGNCELARDFKRCSDNMLNTEGMKAAVWPRRSRTRIVPMFQPVINR
jgi:hypothetical protein